MFYIKQKLVETHIFLLDPYLLNCQIEKTKKHVKYIIQKLFEFTIFVSCQLRIKIKYFDIQSFHNV
jgi:hypothetical protein